MARIYDLIERARAINIIELLGIAIENTRKDLILLQQTQMQFGEASDGGKIGIYKSPAYSLKKNALNPFPGLGFVDLKFTGQFQSEIFADIRDHSVVIDSADDPEKVSRLITLYGDRIFGLNPDSALEYSTNYLMPEFKKLYNNAMRGL